MFSSVQNGLKSTLPYFGYDLEESKGVSMDISKKIENQSLAVESPSQGHRITSKPPSIWKSVAALGMSYLVSSSGENSLSSPFGHTSLLPSISGSWALPLTFMAGLSLFPDVAHAQSLKATFFEALGGPGDDKGYAIEAAAEGDVFVAGYTTSFSMGGNDMLVAKFSRNGMLVWANALGGVGDDRSFAVAATSEGDLFVTGFTTSFGVGSSDVLLGKFSRDGTLLWANTFGGSGSDEGRALMITSEGGLVLAGSTDILGSGDDLLLTKFSSNGTLLWANILSSQGNDKGDALTSAPDGDLYVTGSTNSFGTGSNDVLLSKFSSDGTLLWVNTLGGSSSDGGDALTATLEGDLIFSGTSSSFGAGGSDMLLGKFSSNGTLLWVNSLGGASFEYCRALTATLEGDFIIAGETFSFGAGNYDVLMAKFASNGTLLWTKTLGGVSTDRANAITVTSEEELIVAGYTSSLSVGINDVMLAKLNRQGDIENCSALRSIIPQVESITTILTNVTQNMTVTPIFFQVQDATSALNVTDITNLLNQTTECYAQILVNQSSTSSSSSSPLSSPSASSSSHSQGSPFSSSVFSSTPMRQTSSSPSSPILSLENLLETSNVPEPSTSVEGTIPSITTLVYGESYPIVINGQAIGTFYFTGGDGGLDSSNGNTLHIQLNQDIEDGETIILFTIPEGEEPLWEDLVLSKGSESGCVTTEGVFTTTSEEEHSYQLIFEYESSECSQSMATLKLAAMPVLSRLL